ncbi:MAG: M23 family metallopeptidase [Bacteroidales bacterium]|nr:M23 family metallopeptidase [Bacteroidales bacterium]
MLTKKNGIPYADTREPLGQKRIEVCVKEQESIPFENYYLNRDLPLAGDPLIIMDIVGTDPTNKSNKIGGAYGCKRYTSKAEEQNCITWSQNIENFPSVSGKNKVHDGVDLRAEIETPVYAMFDGVAQILYSTSLGNYVLIKSNVSEHKLTTEIETIWVSYGHLNSTIGTINNSKVFKDS